MLHGLKSQLTRSKGLLNPKMGEGCGNKRCLKIISCENNSGNGSVGWQSVVGKFINI